MNRAQTYHPRDLSSKFQNVLSANLENHRSKKCLDEKSPKHGFPPCLEVSKRACNIGGNLGAWIENYRFNKRFRKQERTAEKLERYRDLNISNRLSHQIPYSLNGIAALASSSRSGLGLTLNIQKALRGEGFEIDGVKDFLDLTKDSSGIFLKVKGFIEAKGNGWAFLKQSSQISSKAASTMAISTFLGSLSVGCGLAAAIVFGMKSLKCFSKTNELQVLLENLKEKLRIEESKTKKERLQLEMKRLNKKMIVEISNGIFYFLLAVFSGLIPCIVSLLILFGIGVSFPYWWPLLGIGLALVGLLKVIGNEVPPNLLELSDLKQKTWHLQKLTGSQRLKAHTFENLTA